MSSSNTPRRAPIMTISAKNTDVAVISKGMAVMLDTAADDSVKKCTATTSKAIGIACQDIAVGAWGDIDVFGRTVCLAGGTVHRGDYVSPDTASKVATTTTNKDRVIGQAQREALVNELFEVLIGVPATLSS